MEVIKTLVGGCRKGGMLPNLVFFPNLCVNIMLFKTYFCSLLFDHFYIVSHFHNLSLLLISFKLTANIGFCSLKVPFNMSFMK